MVKEGYCPICSGCGEDGCCSAIHCTMEGGKFCESYLKDLQFGYLMYNEIMNKYSKELEFPELDELFDKNWEKIYGKE